MHRLIIASCLAVSAVAHAGPDHSAMEAPLVPRAEKIKLYCGNPQLAFVIDWPAFERLDYQVLIAGEEGGDTRFPGHADDPTYVSATRTYILTGNKMGRAAGAPVAGASGIILESFEALCRDHAEMRAPASKITRIVLEPINDMKYQSDKDAIAFARRTNDWSGVQKAMYESKRSDAETHRMYYNRYSLKGTTLTVTFNVLGRSGVAEDYVKILMAVLSGGGDPSDERPAEPDRTRRVPAPPPPPPAERPAEPDRTRRVPPPAQKAPPAERAPEDNVPANKPGPVRGCRDNDTKCKKIEAAKAKRWGPPVNCDKGLYSTVEPHDASKEYAKGDLVSQNWSAEPTQIFRCANGSGCKSDDRPGSGDAWKQVGHCSE